ncbi:septum formation protein Maf [Paenibacillus antri]|uniref:dTTP/UTP pyrophosphatase n=1 Tax=Paenibacillus antri TaxID=2582848 RepID=A0A5R9GGH2_9BACL|nr:Maf family protein [Paenibacillus antri]TLS53526.1 septum formation protein Maf [Paenibacillus antri]
MTERKTLILASSSPRRQELIRLLGYPVEVVPSDADESVEDGWTPAEIVEELSLRKALAVLERLPDGAGGIVVGSDTIVVSNGRALGKPRDEEDAADMLRSLQGRPHEVYSGLALVDATTGGRSVAHRMTRVWMKPMDERRIRNYIATGEPSDKAGAYAIQGFGASLVERMDGDYFTVVGLPVSLAADLLERDFGWRVL